jgi:sirohydrochlorin cobaltochelatase
VSRSLTRRAVIAAFAGTGAFALAPSWVRAQTQSSALEPDFGVLVMAHGGGPTWNREVETMLAPLKNDYALEIAFGMADAASLQDAVARLEAKAARRIGVVRLFVSGESWYERTEQILGLKPGAPPRPDAAAHAGHEGHDAHGGGHSMALWRIETKAAFALSKEGLAEAPEMGAVLAERARALSQDPGRESVLIVAHGPQDDAEDQRWLTQIGARADLVRQAAPFKRVHVETLREDWPEKRVESEARIRVFVEQASQDGGRAIVIPYRVAGFGPYARVLEGLSYASDGRALLPSIEAERWVRRQAEELRTGPLHAPDTR